MKASEYRKRAWENLRGNYWMMLVGIIVVSAIIAFTNFLSIIIAGTLFVGLNTYFIKANAGKEADVLDIFNPFKKQFTNTLVAFLLKNIFIFLWTLLLIIPGIIKSYSYFLVEYLFVHDEELQAQEALKKSEELMQGNRLRLFYLHLSFIGWIILAILTLGIGWFFLRPYIKMAEVEFALELLRDANLISKDTEEVIEADDDYVVYIE